MIAAKIATITTIIIAAKIHFSLVVILNHCVFVFFL
nr:MAG TPA: hypothetical protein [Caudoviricetes sp.]